MIDIENKVYTAVKTAVGTNATMSQTFEPTPKSFPHIQFEMTDCSVDINNISSEAIENYADTKFEINIYSNKTNGKKAECKDLAKTIDQTMTNYGFVRIMYKPIPNIADMSIYRILLRYSGKVSSDKFIYRS